ncbi:TPA: hypothetical protein VAP43_001763 [Streptococcus agalactiae]|nr:hypothetical protein [Streptococcus agalactiae]HEO2476425.1 hypothetical protein [Streptococcus agalactiae]HEQ0508058.1 hypothetical protein [Streptococcus pyogenes]
MKKNNKKHRESIIIGEGMTQAETADNFERKRQYQLMLRPSIREKLNRLAKATGARSASDYLDHLIDDMEE